MTHVYVSVAKTLGFENVETQASRRALLLPSRLPFKKVKLDSVKALSGPGIGDTGRISILDLDREG